MRIAFVSAWYWPAIGGTESAIATLAGTLKKRGHDVVVHTRAFGRTCGMERDPHGICVVRHRELGLAAFWPAAANKADIVHLHGTDRALLAIGATTLRRPLLTLHNGLGREGDEYVGQRRVAAKVLFDRWFARRILNKYARILCLHEEERRRMQSLCGTGAPLAVVPNAVPEDLFVYRSTHVPTGPRDYFVAMGRLAPAKRMDILIRAAAQAKFTLIIAGDGESSYRDYLHQLGKQIGADVRFAGYIEGSAKYELLSNARAMLVGSPHEGLSIAILEAMALGVPVVASPNASRELIEDRVTGWHYDWPSVDSLLTAVRTIDHWDSGVKEVVARAQLLAERFHAHSVAAHHESLYASVS